MTPRIHKALGRVPGGKTHIVWIPTPSSQDRRINPPITLMKVGDKLGSRSYNPVFLHVANKSSFFKVHLIRGSAAISRDMLHSATAAR